MLETVFGNASAVQICCIAISAILIGINKTGLPGIGLLPVILLTLMIDARQATGLQLTMLCTADLFAVAWYHRRANWKLIGRLLPSALAGLAIGHAIIRHLDSHALMTAIGIIILLLAVVSLLREFLIKDDSIPDHWCFSAAAGLAAGITTQIANAAGPIMAIYLLSMRLPKEEYMGTAAWYFLIMNWIKLPVFIFEKRILPESFYTDLAMLPFLLLGAALGILVLKKLPRKLFNHIVLFLSAFAAVYMVWRPLEKKTPVPVPEVKILPDKK